MIIIIIGHRSYRRDDMIWQLIVISLLALGTQTIATGTARLHLPFQVPLNFAFLISCLYRSLLICMLSSVSTMWTVLYYIIITMKAVVFLCITL